MHYRRRPTGAVEADPRDGRGAHHLAGLGIAGVAFGLSVMGLNFLPWTVVAALVVGGRLRNRGDGRASQGRRRGGRSYARPRASRAP